MKKIIIGVLAIAVIGFSGIVVSKKVAKATDVNDPKMLLSTESKNINVLKNTEFEIKFSVTPGVIKFDATNPEGETRELKENILKIEGDSLATLVEVIRIDYVEGQSKETKLEIDEKQLNKTVDLGTIIYNRKNHDYEGNMFDVILRFKANNIGVIEDISKNFTLEYKNLKGDIGKANIDKDTIVKVSILDVDYKIGEIEGLGIDGQVANNGSLYYDYPLNKFFTMEYMIHPGDLQVVDADENPIALSNLGLQENRLIYTVDKSIIDEVGGNDESVRDSLVKSLESLKVSNPKAKVSLVTFGNKAEIISVADENILSIDELIKEVQNIESTSTPGNLGDAIRVAQILANQYKKSSSIILVTGENPKYYTQISEGDSSMLYTRIEKEGVTKEDSERAEEYVNKVVNDILVNEEDDTRWYSIVYNTSNEVRVVDNVIKKFEGYTLEVNNPYYADFELINERAISPSIVKVDIKAEAINKDLVEVHEKSLSQTLEFVFTESDGDLKAKPIKIDILARIKKLDEKNPVGVDVADIKNIKVTSTAQGFLEKNSTFNNGDNQLVWRVDATMPYFVEYGLFTGRFKGIELPKFSERELAEKDKVGMAEVASAAITLDILQNADLAIENTFGVGVILKTKKNEKVVPTIKLGSKKDQTVRDISNQCKVYEHDKKTNSFKLSVDTPDELKGDKIYLITIDHYIDGKTYGQQIDDIFEIGVNIKDSTDSEGEFWGIEVKCVDKPEHF